MLRILRGRLPQRRFLFQVKINKPTSHLTLWGVFEQLGAVQTSFLCCAELNSGIIFDKSMASESNFWIKLGKQLSATRLWLDSDSNVVLLSRHTKFINYNNVFWRDCVPWRELWGELLLGFSISWSDSTLARRVVWITVVSLPCYSRTKLQFSSARQKHDVWTGP